jgi:two-component system sensor histidine kinase/response regulator
MTANAMQGDRELCLQAGMNDHVAKPIEPQDLFRALLKWIQPSDGNSVFPADLTTRPALTATDVPVIEGLNTEAGLRRVMGKRHFYVAMLEKFVAGQSDAMQRVRDAMDANDPETARRIAHTLKGVAGNLGILPVQEAARALEYAFNDNAPPERLEGSIDACDRVLADFVAKLVAALPAQTKPAPLQAADRHAVADLCRKLRSLLSDDDMQASDLLADNESLIRSAWGESYADFDRAIRAFEYEDALALLSEFVERQDLPID